MLLRLIAQTEELKDEVRELTVYIKKEVKK